MYNVYMYWDLGGPNVLGARGGGTARPPSGPGLPARAAPPSPNQGTCGGRVWVAAAGDGGNDEDGASAAPLSQLAPRPAHASPPSSDLGHAAARSARRHIGSNEDRVTLTDHFFSIAFSVY